MQILSYFPGQKVTIFLDTFDGYGERADGYFMPYVNRIIFPDLSLSAGFPTNMTQLDVGLYYFQFTLPLNAAAVGSYLVDVFFGNPATGYENQTLYQILVSAPFGNFGALPIGPFPR